MRLSLDKDRIFYSFFNFLKKDVVYHVLAWLAIYSVFVLIDLRNNELTYVLAKEFINVAFYAAIVYINLFYLFPTYLTQRSMIWHLAALAITSLIITPIKTVILYFLFTKHPDIQIYFINHQNAIFLSTFFVGIASTIYNIMSDWLLHQREKKELQSQTLQSELRFLKSQINPHFLFNTLNNLYALTLKKSDLAPEIVLKLSEMMRYMLYECNERRVPLKKEVNYLINYLELERLRQGKKMTIDFELNGYVTGQKIAPLLFIPFLENAFKHGISNQISDGFVNIVLDIDETKVNLHIENSKASSIPTPNAKKSGGIGLVNVKRRLSLQYPGKHELVISNDPNIYKIHLFVDLTE